MRVSKTNACVAASVLTLAVPTLSRAAVITEPAVVSGGLGQNPIDPPGAQDRDLAASGLGFTEEAILEARADLRVLQSFTGFVGGSSGVSNGFDFTTPGFPDIRFTTTGATSSGTSGTGNDISGSDQNTSAGTAYSLALGSSTGSNTTRIEFGTFTSATAFTPGGSPVDAVGFMIAGLRAGQSVTAEFFTDTGVSLTTLTGTGATGDNNGVEIYFGYDAPNAMPIGSVTVIRTATSATGNSVAALDDFAFTVNVIPEPTTAAAVAGLGGLLTLRRRRTVG